MNLDKVIDSITKQLRDYLGDKKAIVGLSGGIDSSVVAYFCVKAVGEENVVGIEMPYGDQSIEDSTLIVEKLYRSRFERPPFISQVVNIKPIVDSFPNVGFMDKLTKGNIMARIRMVVLYNVSNDLNGIVVGTTNKTEAEIGYYTKYGDGAVDIEPIADLYKTEVWEVGRMLGVPQKIIDKKPTAGLWEDQTDEDEFRMTYQEMDKILQAVEGDNLINVLAKYGEAKVKKVLDLIESSEHKKHMPPAFKVR